jgi:hypothetical protein
MAIESAVTGEKSMGSSSREQRVFRVGAPAPAVGRDYSGPDVFASRPRSAERFCRSVVQ